MKLEDLGGFFLYLNPQLNAVAVLIPQARWEAVLIIDLTFDLGCSPLRSLMLPITDCMLQFLITREQVG